jgi:hypothetical protein
MSNKEEFVTVNGKDYPVSELTGEQKRLVIHHNELNRRIAETKFTLEQLVVGREGFAARLVAALEAPAETLAAE